MSRGCGRETRLGKHSSRVYEHLNKGGGPGEECDVIKLLKDGLGVSTSGSNALQTSRKMKECKIKGFVGKGINNHTT